MFTFDSMADPAFQKARHQNNLYFAQECLRAPKSQALVNAQKIIADIAQKNQTTPTLVQQIQDAFAVDKLYLLPHEIEKFFCDPKNPNMLRSELLLSTTGADPQEALDTAWGWKLLEIMRDSVEGYGFDKKSVGETKDAYESLANHLKNQEAALRTKNASGPIKFQDIWVEVQKCKADAAKGESENDYMGNFAKRAGFTFDKIQRHEDYLDTEFYRLAPNNWWVNAAASQSLFRDKVLAKNQSAVPQCLFRKSTEPRRGVKQYQPTATGNTTRFDLKNSPFHMAELAELLNQTGEATFATTSGLDPNSALAKLSGKPNPFNDAIFKIGNYWYVLGAKEANGTLVVQRRLVTFNPPDKEPKRDSVTGGYLNILRMSEGSMLTLSDLANAKDAAEQPVNLVGIVEEGVKKLIGLCGYGVVNNVPANPVAGTQIVQASGGVATQPVFELDDTAFLMSMLLVPGWNLHDSTNVTTKTAQEEIFAAVDDAGRAPYLAAINAANAAPTYQTKYTALKNAQVFTYFHAHPEAYAMLSKHAQTAQNAYDTALPARQIAAAAREIVLNRATDQAAMKARMAADVPEAHAFKAVVLGQILSEFVVLSYSSLSDDDICMRLNEHIGNENKYLATSAKMPLVTSASKDVMLQSINAALGVALTGADGRTALFQSQRDELDRAYHAYPVSAPPAAGAPPAMPHNHNRFISDLATQNISLDACDIVPKSDVVKFGAREKNAVEAIVYAGVVKAIYDAKTSDKADLEKVIDDQMANYKAQLGFEPSTPKPRGGSATAEDLLAWFITQVQTSHTNATTGTPAAIGYDVNLNAINDLLAVVAPASGPAMTLANLQTATLNQDMVNNLELTKVQEDLVRRRFLGEAPGYGWSYQGKTAAGVRRFCAASSDGNDYLDKGLIQLIQQGKAVEIPLTTRDNSQQVYCVPKAENSEQARFHFVVRDSSNVETPFDCSPEEGRYLRQQLQEVLMTHAQTALSQSVSHCNKQAESVYNSVDNKDVLGSTQTASAAPVQAGSTRNKISM